jgi:hypothetical protein
VMMGAHGENINGSTVEMEAQLGRRRPMRDSYSFLYLTTGELGRRISAG